MGLACYGLGKQGFAGTGRANEQCALWQLCADCSVFLRIVQEVDNLLQRLLGLVLTGNILECHAGLFFHIDLRLTLADIADGAKAAVCAAACHHDASDQEEAEQQQKREQQPREQHGAWLDNLACELHAVGLELLNDRGQFYVGQNAGVVDRLNAGICIFTQREVNAVGLELHLGNLVVLELGQESVVGNLLLSGTADQIDKLISENRHDCNHNEKPCDGKFRPVVIVVIIVFRTPFGVLICHGFASLRQIFIIIS